MRQDQTGKKSPWAGFTLAEVLIALSILGVVAAIAIPTLLQYNAEQQKKLVYKEAISEVTKALYPSYLDGSFTGNADSLIQQRMNVLKVYPSTVGADGLMTYAYQLPNGATLSYHDTRSIESFRIDYNGNAPPNVMFQDQLYFWVNMSNQSSCGLKPGGVGPVDPTICPKYTYSPYTNQQFLDYFNQMIVD